MTSCWQAGRLREQRRLSRHPLTWGNASAGSVLAVAVPVVRPVGFVESRWTLMGVVNWSMLRPGVRLPALVTPSTVTLYCGKGGGAPTQQHSGARSADVLRYMSGTRRRVHPQLDLGARVQAGERHGQAAAGEGQHGAADARAVGLANGEDVLRRDSEAGACGHAVGSEPHVADHLAFRPCPAEQSVRPAMHTFVNAFLGSVAVAEPEVGPVATARVRYSEGSIGVVSCSWLSPRVRPPSRLIPVTVTLYCEARVPRAAWSRTAGRVAASEQTSAPRLAYATVRWPSPWCWASGR